MSIRTCQFSKRRNFRSDSQVCLSFYKGSLVICLRNAYLRSSLRHFDRYYVGILTFKSWQLCQLPESNLMKYIAKSNNFDFISILTFLQFRICPNVSVSISRKRFPALLLNTNPLRVKAYPQLPSNSLTNFQHLALLVN